VRTMCRLKRASESLSFLVSSACVSAVPRAVVSRTRTSPAPRRRRETNWKIVTRCAPRRTRGFRGRLRPPLEGSAGHPPGGSGRAFPRVPTAQAGSNPAPVRISVRAVRGRRRQSRRSSARASNFLRASSRKCRRRPEESSRHAHLGTTDGRARRKEISRGLNARGTHRGHVERFQDVEVLLRGVDLGFGVCGSRGCQPIVEVGIGWGNFLSTSIPTRRTHGYAPAALTDLALGLPFATPRPRFVAWNASVTFAGAMVLVPRVESATRTESSRSPDVNIFLMTRPSSFRNIEKE
jgi:hypothetical protein